MKLDFTVKMFDNIFVSVSHVLVIDIQNQFPFLLVMFLFDFDFILFTFWNLYLVYWWRHISIHFWPKIHGLNFQTWMIFFISFLFIDLFYCFLPLLIFHILMFNIPSYFFSFFVFNMFCWCRQECPYIFQCHNPKYWDIHKLLKLQVMRWVI